jgi:hypothetical protein
MYGFRFIEIGYLPEVSQDISGILQATVLDLNPFVQETKLPIAQDQSLNNRSTDHFFVP